MHVVFYSPSWPPAQAANGIVTYVHQMREALRRRGHLVSVVAGKAEPSPGIYPVSRSTWAPWRRRWARLRGRHPASTQGADIAAVLRQIHLRQPIDLIEIEESFGWCAYVSALGLPTVVKLHGPAFLSLVEEELDHPLSAEKIVAEGQALRVARYITSPSRGTLAATLAKYSIVCETAYAPNPIDVSRYGVWSQAQAGHQHVLFVGRFDKRKGADRVLYAFKALLRRLPEARLTLVGPDEGLTRPDGGRTKFADFASQVFTPEELRQIDFRGPLPPSHVEELRLRATVIVIGARWENAPYAALEAMSQGCPIAALDCNGVNEVVIRDQTGLLADSVEMLADDLHRLLTDAAFAARLGAQARQFVLETHSSDVALDAALEIYSRARN
jgi:glycosyltransferase involved in cell wall biosynthesis